MAKKKAARDKIMATKSDKRASSSSILAGQGQVVSLRHDLATIAHGKPCAVVQFIKGACRTGERDLIERHFSDICQFHTMGEGFAWETQDRAETSLRRGRLEKGQGTDPRRAKSMVVLDEINIALRYDYLDFEEVIEFLKTGKADHDACRPDRRNAKEELLRSPIW